MRSNRIGRIVASAIGLSLIWASAAQAQLSGSATIQGIQNGSNYDYTIKLTNTGASNIGTFWFAWTPPGAPVEYDFLPSVPSAAGGPAGWIDHIVTPGNPNAASIEYYNSTGSLLAAGQTDTFTFTSVDSPTTLQNGRAFGIFPFTDSFIYAGAPLTGSFSQANPTFVVPEPSTICLGAMACVFFVGHRRRRAA